MANINKKSPGRPKLPDEIKKVGFSIKIKPNLLFAIKEKTNKTNRNAEIEALLEGRYL